MYNPKTINVKTKTKIFSLLKVLLQYIMSENMRPFAIKIDESMFHYINTNYLFLKARYVTGDACL